MRVKVVLWEKGLNCRFSEYSPNFGGAQYSFVQRNRITSGLSEALINVASRASGEAMAQTKAAFNQKVPIFVPSLSLNILPNGGIKDAILSYAAIEVKDGKDFIEKFQNPSACKSHNNH